MIHDLIIIGAGPAGITVGIYASRLGLKTLLITKGFGGQVSDKAVSINNYPGFSSISGQGLVEEMKKHLKSLPVDIQIDEAVSLEKKEDNFVVLTKGGKKYESVCAVIASGAKAKHLNIPGEEEFAGRGVSYCGICDGPVFKNKIIAVIGGGNAGFETAIFLSDIAKKIYILEFSDEPGAFEENQKIVKSSGKAEVIVNAEAKEIKGDKFVTSLVYKDKKTEEEKILEVDGVFVQAGYVPAVSFVKNLVDFNEKGEIKTDFETMKTKTPGLFAAGDVIACQFKQIISSAGDGAKAALAAHNYIKHKRL